MARPNRQKSTHRKPYNNLHRIDECGSSTNTIPNHQIKTQIFKTQTRQCEKPHIAAALINLKSYS
jgi:hypothetical protein